MYLVSIMRDTCFYGACEAPIQSIYKVSFFNLFFIELFYLFIYFCFFIYFLLLYRILYSVKPQPESAIGIHTSPPF